MKTEKVRCKTCGCEQWEHELSDAVHFCLCRSCRGWEPAPTLAEQFAALTTQIERLKESLAVEREDANQWLREEAIERKRADAAETEVARLREAATIALKYLEPGPCGQHNCMGCLCEMQLAYDELKKVLSHTVAAPPSPERRRT